MERSVGGDMGGKEDAKMLENTVKQFIEYVRKQVEEQDPVFLISVVVALAAIIITCGKVCVSLLPLTD